MHPNLSSLSGVFCLLHCFTGDTPKKRAGYPRRGFTLLGGLFLSLYPLFSFAAPLPPTPSSPLPSVSSSNDLQALSPSMRVLWRLHNEQLRMLDTNIFYKGKQKLELSFLGGNYQEIFAGSAEAQKLAASFHGLQIGAFVCSSLGLGATLASTIILIALPQAVLQPVAGGVLGPELFWGLLLGGTVVSLLGSILAQSSYSFLVRAADTYNRETFERIFKEANGGKLPAAHRTPLHGRSVLYAIQMP